MFKNSQRVRHSAYGDGEVMSSMPNKQGLIQVAFDNEFESLVKKETVMHYYMELELSRFQEVHFSELEKLTSESKSRMPHCHSCKKQLNSNTHSKCQCNWLKCDCGSCGCDYEHNQV